MGTPWQHLAEKPMFLPVFNSRSLIVNGKFLAGNLKRSDEEEDEDDDNYGDDNDHHHSNNNNNHNNHNHNHHHHHHNHNHNHNHNITQRATTYHNVPQRTTTYHNDKDKDNDVGKVRQSCNKLGVFEDKPLRKRMQKAMMYRLFPDIARIGHVNEEFAHSFQYFSYFFHLARSQVDFPCSTMLGSSLGQGQTSFEVRAYFRKLRKN